MKHDFKIFIGWDFNQAEAAEMCAESIHRFTGNEVPINFIQRDVLAMKGLYWRPHHPGQSTDFAFTRFLTPYLAGYYGTALFCDADFFWRKDPREILQYQDRNAPVQVVQHALMPTQVSDVKMAGKAQKWYPKKNWSSMMMFNMENMHNLPTIMRLDPYMVSEATPAWLHEFDWCPQVTQSASLPLSFNHLVGYDYTETDPHAVHFTDGGPWLSREYESVEFASEWLDFRKNFAHQGRNFV